MKININADMGESFGKYRIGDDSKLVSLIGSANIACGMHAGDPTIMHSTVKLAVEAGVSIGAHPGFNDLWGFGRRQIKMSPCDLEYLVAYQIGALIAIAGGQNAQVTHVKPHGALNNMAHVDSAYATAIAKAIKSVDANLIFVANVNSELERAGTKAGLRVARESYVDRRYNDYGQMLSRDRDDAVITDGQEAAEQVLRFITDGAIHATSGKRIPAEIDTFCIHGDEPTAVAVMREVRLALEREGVSIVTLPRMLGIAD